MGLIFGCAGGISYLGCGLSTLLTHAAWAPKTHLFCNGTVSLKHAPLQLYFPAGDGETVLAFLT